jgi:hypothetical protein
VRPVLAGAAFLVAVASSATAQGVPEKYENRVLAIPALAGQTVAVLPLTSLLRDSTIASDTTLGPWGARATGIKRFDSLFGGFLQDNIVDTKWVMPEDLRKMSKRSAGYLPDPDFIGHAALWNPRIEKKVPDPVQSRLRSVAAVSGARSILIPVGARLARDTAGLLTAQVGLVIVDARIGDIRWRTYTTGRGPTPDAAVRSALMASLPVDVLAQ